MDKIEFTKENFKRFKNEYRIAKANGDSVFTFENKEVVLDYAKYLIEYLETQLKNENK